MTDSEITAALLIIISIVLIIWDVYVAFFNEISNRKDTISGIFKTIGTKIGAVPFAFGVLAGHFWMQRSKPVFDEKWSIFSLVMVAGLISGVHALAKHYKIRIGAFIYLIYVLVGIVLGHIFWPQG